MCNGALIKLSGPRPPSSALALANMRPGGRVEKLGELTAARNSGAGQQED